MDISYEKGEEQVDVHEKLAAEVYGVGEVDKFSSWGLCARAWVRRLGAEENGIERIPPEARIKQNPLGMAIACLFADETYFTFSRAEIAALPRSVSVRWDQAPSPLDGTNH